MLLQDLSFKGQWLTLELLYCFKIYQAIRQKSPIFSCCVTFKPTAHIQTRRSRWEELRQKGQACRVWYFDTIIPVQPSHDNVYGCVPTRKRCQQKKTDPSKYTKIILDGPKEANLPEFNTACLRLSRVGRRTLFSLPGCLLLLFHLFRHSPLPTASRVLLISSLCLFPFPFLPIQLYFSSAVIAGRPAYLLLIDSGLCFLLFTGKSRGGSPGYCCLVSPVSIYRSG